MNSQQYQRIGQLYHAALDLPPESRGAFLDGACGSDEALRREVQLLLEAHEQAGDFLSTPAMGLAARWLTPQDDETLSGTIGSYELLSLLGRGGMGEVYLAEDTRLGRKVAVKLLRAALTSNPNAVRRFEQEARAASSLNHPNIVTIHEIGDMNGRRFLAMELVEGQSLAGMIGRPVPMAFLARTGAQLAKALAVAHAAGIVHRDIKPENVMVRDDGYVKLLDFGVARLADGAAAGSPRDVTGPSVILGTPRYMSPEQARGDVAKNSSDVYSLGVVLYELATGVHPFEAEGINTPAMGSGNTPDPGRRVADLPPALGRLLLRMLDRQEAARPTASEVESELTSFAATLFERGDVGSRSGPWEIPKRESQVPTERTPLVGREAELAAVQSILLDSSARLLTLTGPGGTGKTRLATHAGMAMAAHAEGGVHFVDLAPIQDSKRIASAIATTLGVRETADRPLVPAISEHLRSLGRTLLILDNFEQVSDAAPIVRELLDACPALKVLVTSRLVLRIYGEQEFPVPPLPLPDAGAIDSPAALLECPSIALFVQRAAASRPGFALTAKNANPVVEICRRLDGLPLAIELAAARVKVLPPADLLSRIERRLELLTGGARDVPERQRTLRATVKWSYDLLSPEEQKLFRRLSVFAGGCTLEGAEAVCDTAQDLGIDILNGVTSLVDNSLLVMRSMDEAEPRFVMLETFREYGRERLIEAGEAGATERAHAAYMLVLAEEEQLSTNREERETWLRTCDAEHDNFRTAISNLVSAGDAEWALRLAGSLFRFWEQRDHLTEGRETLARVLAMPGAEAPTRHRARALYGATVLADVQGEVDAAEILSSEAVDIYRQLDDLNGVASALTAKAWQSQRQGRHAEATALFGETVSLWQQLRDGVSADLARSNMANAAKAEGRFDLARGLLEQVVASSQGRRDTRGVASALNGLGDVAAARGDHDLARDYHHQSLSTYVELDDRWGIARVLADLGNVDLQAGDCAAASQSLERALRAFRALGHQRGVARQLEALAVCAVRQARHTRAVTLASAAAAIRQKIGTPAKPAEREQLEQALATARIHLDADAYSQAWDEGRAGTVEKVLNVE